MMRKISPDPALSERQPTGITHFIREGWNYVIGNQQAQNYFGPGEPIGAQAPQESAGRQFDYGMARNIAITPRADEGISFDELRSLADNHDVTRLAIETRKDQIAKMPWTIRQKVADSDRVRGDVDEALMEFFASPDKRHTFDQWRDMILEDLLTIDAPCVFIRRTVGGDVWGFEPIDGGSITIKTDAYGRVPLEGTAYTQVIKGMEAVHYDVNSLLYMPRRLRTNHIYGFPPIEQIIVTVNIALRRQMHQLSYYTHGSAPDLIMQCPPEWKIQQIRDFQDYFDGLLTGNSMKRRQARFVPGGVDPYDTKAQALKDDYDEWLARIVCFAFSIPPTAFVKQVNRATANTAQQTALQEGLEPLKKWFTSFMHACLRHMGRADVEFCWEQEESVDPEQRAKIYAIACGNKPWLSADEVRAKYNLEPGAPKPDPVAPPPMFGQSKPVAAIDETPVEEGGEEQPVDDAEKLAKRKKLPVIRRDRPALLKKEKEWASKLQMLLAGIRKRSVRRILTAYERLNVSEKMEKRLSDEQAQELANLIETGDFDAVEKFLIEAGEDVYSLGVSAAAVQLGLDANSEMVTLANENAVKWATENATAKIKGMIDATRDSIKSTVSQSLDEGWSNAQLADELVDDWGFSPERAEMIARSESAMADLAGNVGLYKESGLVDSVEWLAADVNPCEVCDELNGQVTEIGGKFTTSDGDEIDAEDIAHPSCRCDRLPVLNTSEEGGE